MSLFGDLYKNVEPLPPKPFSLIDLWTASDAWHAKKEGWALYAAGQSGGKWAIFSLTDKSDKDVETFVIERAASSQRHWLAAKIAKII
jgi:hypothetical protein